MEFKRLTGWDKGRPYVRECFERTAEEGGCEYMDTHQCIRCEDSLNIVRRLAEYEDSGLSPNRVAELLKKLTEAISGQLDSDITLGDIYGHVVCGDLLSALDKLAEYESSGLSPEQVRRFADSLTVR
ncbi:hypothetical protein [Pelotomaculum propionicicum]|uniref:Uncharacterized protein n=1 Tax=Pelotomaculum propionicicum TaxID=258475 RepID=A0A4Y7RWV8_9FIRM|nr:hypothetical protein [Pelotomaculum propionicicum]TEB13391.1 hypothetical protein Pmgp_00285 [Pelotomaculum propionicicum]